MAGATRRAGAGLVALTLGLGLLAGCSDDSGEGESATGVAAVESPAVLDPWFDAVRRDDRDAARIVVLGDSVSEGYGLGDHLERRWLDRLQAALRARSGTPECPTTAGGWHGTTSLVPADYRAPTLPDPLLTGPTVLAPTLGPGGRGLTLKPGGAVTWTVTADSVDVGYRTRFAGGPLQIEVDGVVPPHGRAVPTDTDPRAERAVWSSGDLGPGQHTVTVRNALPTTSSTAATVTDLTPFRGDRDRCVHVLDASRSGVSAQTIAQTPTYLKDSLSLDPDLLLVPLGFNDQRADVPAAQFGRSLDSLVQQARGMGYEGPILLVGWFTPQTEPGRPAWSTYLQQMRARAAHERVSFVDLSAVLPRADPRSRYFIDGLHPSAAGQPLIAASLTEILAPPGELSSTVGASSDAS
jgi:lysophospholipase L1-like esterase